MTTKKNETLEESVARLHAVLVGMGRYGPLRDHLDFDLSDLTAGQVHVLARLGHDGPLPMGELARRIGISLPGCTRLVDRMKDAGHVLRERDTEDRRVVIVRLAAAGRRLFEQIDEGARVKMQGLLSVLEPDDRQQFVDILEKLATGIARLIEEDPGVLENAS
ncbi:MAG: MarR family transcriptional regulator [Deltaproteobacteria bacterium]|nr:MarR family transcriptional regulator [Deltaproteobacteria bacterium]